MGGSYWMGFTWPAPHTRAASRAHSAMRSSSVQRASSAVAQITRPWLGANGFTHHSRWVQSDGRGRQSGSLAQPAGHCPSRGPHGRGV